MFFWMQVWFKCDPDNLGAFKWLSTRPYRNVHNMFSRRGLMHLWLAFVMASADDGACALQKPLRKPKMRDNYLYFDGPSKHAIGAIRRNKPLNHRWTTVWWSVLSWYLFDPIWMSGQAVMNQKKW